MNKIIKSVLKEDSQDLRVSLNVLVGAAYV